MEKKQKKIDWYCGYAPFVVCKKRFRQNSEIKKCSKSTQRNNPMWLKFHLKSFQKGTKQMRKKKIQKISFFWYDPFSGYTDKPKKFKSLTAMLKSLLKCTLNIIFIFLMV